MTETYLAWATLTAFAILLIIPLSLDSQKIKSQFLGFIVLLVQLAWVTGAIIAVAMSVIWALSVVTA
jgi:hypothetical protein